MQPPFQNGTYYSPGSSVLTYFLAQGLSSVVGIGLVVAAAWYLIHAFVAPSLDGFVQVSKNLTPYYHIGYEVIIAVAIVAAIVSLVSSIIDYKSIKFMFDDFAFHIERGIFSRSEISIPYRQIQNVNHDQTLSERAWGMVRVVVETAGTDQAGINGNSDGVLPLLDAHLASSVETELMRRSSPQPVAPIVVAPQPNPSA